MSWITETIEFCKSVGRGGSQAQEEDVMHATAKAKWLAEFEDSLVAEHGPALTPKQHGDRLLKLTKERALQRLANDGQTVSRAS